MKIKKIRQMMKTLSDDTRIRVINLLNKEELSVTEICEILDVQQSNLSKHLGRLRLTGFVNDNREGFNVYYSLVTPDHGAHRNLIEAITVGLADDDILEQDLKKMKEVLAISRASE